MTSLNSSPFKIGQDVSFSFTKGHEKVVITGFIIDGFYVDEGNKFRKEGEYRILIRAEGRYFERHLKNVILL